MPIPLVSEEEMESRAKFLRQNSPLPRMTQDQLCLGLEVVQCSQQGPANTPTSASLSNLGKTSAKEPEVKKTGVQSSMPSSNLRRELTDLGAQSVMLATGEIMIKSDLMPSTRTMEEMASSWAKEKEVENNMPLGSREGSSERQRELLDGKLGGEEEDDEEDMDDLPVLAAISGDESDDGEGKLPGCATKMRFHDWLDDASLASSDEESEAESAPFSVQGYVEPWKRGVMNYIHGDGELFELFPPRKEFEKVKEIPLPRPASKVKAAAKCRPLSTFPKTTQKLLKVRKHMVKSGPKEAAVRSRALEKWRSTLEGIGLEHIEDLKDPATLPQMLSTVMSRKASHTIVKRGGDFARVVRHLLTHKSGWPPDIDDFLDFLEKRCKAATSARSTLEALRFAHHVVGVKGLAPLYTNRLANGIASRKLDQKAATRQARAFSPEEMRTIEQHCLDASARSEWSQGETMAVFGLQAQIVLRSRFADLGEVYALVEQGNILRAPTRKTKTAAETDRSSCLEMVGLTTMFARSRVKWFDAAGKWRRSQGMDDLMRDSIEEAKAHPLKYPLYPARNSAGWLQESAAVGEVNDLLLLICQRMGIDGSGVSTHSAKASLLTFASSLSPKSCARLGYHCLPGESKSAKTYDRNALRVPLMRLSKLVEAQKKEWGDSADMEAEEQSPISPSSEAQTDEGEADSEALESESTAEDDELLVGAKSFRPAELALAIDQFESRELGFSTSGRFFANPESGECHAERAGSPLTSMCGLQLSSFLEVAACDLSSFSCCERCNKSGSRDNFRAG